MHILPAFDRAPLFFVPNHCHIVLRCIAAVFVHKSKRTVFPQVTNKQATATRTAKPAAAQTKRPNSLLAKYVGCFVVSTTRRHC